MPRQAKPKRLLSIAHFHPDLVRGGGQQAAYELFKGFEARPDYDAFFIAAVPGDHRPQLVKPGVSLCRYDGRPNEFLFANRAFDFFWLSNTELRSGGWDQVMGFLQSLRPDIIHFNHVLNLGVEFLRAARVACPQARIIYTLHEFLPICHADGQMVRTRNQGLCDGASPTRCALCFPERRPAEFFLRDRWLRAHFACVDRFVAPSRFLRERYLEWGVAAEDVVVIDYGRSAAGTRLADDGPATEKRNRFGFFGSLIDCKGLDCLIDAVAHLVRHGITDFEVRVHGANLQNAREALQKKFSMAVDSFPQFKFLGSYFSHEGPRHAAAVDWFVVPSIWWENSPLVIQEAFIARRPVLCSNLGGMAEKVRDGVDGLHFAVGDAAALADTMRRCLSEPGLWDRLAANIPDILTVEDAVEQHRELCFEGELARWGRRQLWEARWAESVKVGPGLGA